MIHRDLSSTRRWLLVPLLFAMGGVSALAIELPGPLVGTGWLAEHRGEVVVLDVREDATTYLGQTPPSDAKPDLRSSPATFPGQSPSPGKRSSPKARSKASC